MNSSGIYFILICLVFFSCSLKSRELSASESFVRDSLRRDSLIQDSIMKEVEKEAVKALTADDIEITKELLYDKYTLKDTYPYNDGTREFQWDKIKEKLALLENIQLQPSTWAILRNYKNRNGEAPLIKTYKRDAYGRIALGVERYQSVPLYLLTDSITPVRYAQDGELTQWIEDEGSFSKAVPIHTDGEWLIPQKYIKILGDSVRFNKAIFVDRHNQNAATLERTEKGHWVVRSMNPVTTGRHRPPYAQETPLGIFVLQEKKPRMVYLKDGSAENGGFAPYASRFTDGAYLHGVPVNAPKKDVIEYSWSLGTTPRSHMCVRNATSHAKFIYDWAPVNETIIFVLE